jgi:hypothetical protein
MKTTRHKNRKFERRQERLKNRYSYPILSARVWTEEELAINEANQIYEMVLEDMVQIRRKGGKPA